MFTLLDDSRDTFYQEMSGCICIPIAQHAFPYESIYKTKASQNSYFVASGATVLGVGKFA